MRGSAGQRVPPSGISKEYVRFATNSQNSRNFFPRLSTPCRPFWRSFTQIAKPLLRKRSNRFWNDLISSRPPNHREEIDLGQPPTWPGFLCHLRVAQREQARRASNKRPDPRRP